MPNLIFSKDVHVVMRVDLNFIIGNQKKARQRMADKEQIMINGVDVSGCLFYQSNFEEDYDVRIKHFCSNWHNSCESSNNSNCYFKQLARKTQEYNELTLQIRETQEYSDTCAECKDDIFTNVKTSYSQIEVESRALAKIISSLKSKTQECEQKDERILELTKENKESQKWIKEWNKYVGLVRSWITQAAKDLGLDTEHSFGVEHFTFAVRCLKEEHEKLKQECEELEKQLSETKTFDLFSEKIIEKLNTSQIMASIFQDYSRYRKALEEIEEELKEDIYCESQECGCDDFEECLRCTKDLILNIINEAKDCQ